MALPPPPPGLALLAMLLAAPVLAQHHAPAAALQGGIACEKLSKTLAAGERHLGKGLAQLPASATDLAFAATFAAANATRCPQRISWILKNQKVIEESSCETPMELNDGFCKATVRYSGLQPDTSYNIEVKTKMKNERALQWRYDASTNARTCSSEVPEVEDLLVHSSSPRGLELSWQTPLVSCLGDLKYTFRVNPVGPPDAQGNSFPNQRPWVEQTPVAACDIWPQRRCFHPSSSFFAPGLRYQVQVRLLMYVRETGRWKESKIANVEGTTTNTAPNPPLEFRCLRAESAALELSWKCPLRIGGLLRRVHVLVRSFAEGAVLRNMARQIALRSVYFQRVDGLQPDSLYNVSVWLETEAGIAGAPASLLLGTAREGVVEEGGCRREPPVRATQAPAGGGDSWWAWLPGPAFVILAVLVLALGNRLRKWMRRRSSQLNDPSVLRHNFCSRVWFEGEEVFIEGLDTLQRDRFSDHDYESIKSSVYSRSLVARRMLSASYTTLSTGSMPGAECPAAHTSTAPVYANADADALERYLPMDGGRCNSVSYVPPQRPGPRPPMTPAR